MNDSAKLAVKPLSLTDVEPENTAATYQMPKAQAKELLVELVASGGLVVNEAGDVDKMSISAFADRIGWSERTMYNWIDSDPDWDAKVFKAISKIHGAKRVARVLRGVFTQASLGKQAQAELYLRHFWPDYISPKAEVEHDLSKGFADLINQAQKGNIIDGQVVEPDALPDGSAPDTGTHTE